MEEEIGNVETPQMVVSPDGRKISVSFERKITDGDYGSVAARAFVEHAVPEGANISDTAKAIGDLFCATASAVFDQLQVTYHFDQETGVLVEDKKPVTEARVAQATNATFTSESGSLKVANPDQQDGPLEDWIVEACKKDGVSSVFDNRKGSRGSNKPWYREAAKAGQGHGANGDPKAYWPPK